jgi:hypothetical protein
LASRSEIVGIEGAPAGRQGVFENVGQL